MSRQSPNGTYWKKRALKAEAELKALVAKLQESPPFSMCEGMRNIAQQGGSAGCQHEWRGPWPKPTRYTCGCGTLVFTTHAAAE